MSTPFYDLASLVLVPSGYKTSKVYAQKPLTTDGQLAFTRASTATRVNSAGLIESVAVNVPRLDYTGGGCPKLLLEPQRTNLLLNSENYSGSNWSLGNATVTNNQAVSPDGYTNADLLKEDSTNNFHRLFDVGKTISTTTAYTSSVFVKNASGTRNFRISFGGGFGEQYVTFNVINGTIVASDNATGTIVSYGNGWYRCTATATSGAVANVNAIYWLTSGNTETYQGNGTSGVYLYGCGLEVGSYPTSYIPTLGAAVTRSADAASKTGISALIGQTEGTLFFECEVLNGVGIELGNSTAGGDFANSLQVAISPTSTNAGSHVGGVSQVNIAAAGRTGNQKIAFAYGLNNYAFYINGIQIATDNSATVPAMSAIIFNHVDLGTVNGAIKQTLLFKTRLSNAALAELTA